MEGAFFLFVLLTVLGSLVNGYIVSLNKRRLEHGQSD